MSEEIAPEINVQDMLLGSEVINTTGWDISPDEVLGALRQNPEFAAVTRWTADVQRRSGGLLERDRYVTPGRLLEQFDVAYDAAENDDVVSGVLETTESLAYGRITVETEDDDEENIWNQIMDDIDLEARMREMWREMFIVSQFYCAIWWGNKSYKVKGKSPEGVKRKRTFDNLMVPLGMTVMDPHKVVPVGNFLFGKEVLCYAANRGEKDAIDRAIERRDGTDPMIEQLLVMPFEPSLDERRQLTDYGFPVDRLYLLNPRNVYRHTATRPPYKPFADVRMKSVFELLDLKNQLKQMDRAHLIGGTNFIVLIKKGSDAMPARPEELANLNNMVRTVARIPVIVGDHRLEVEIVTPKLDQTLDPTRYNGLDARITARLYQMFMTGNFSAGAKGDDSIKLARVVARGLESRRHMIRRSVERNVLQKTFDANDQFKSEVELRFHPKHVALDFDPALATYLLDLRDRGDISRETVLEEIDFDQDTEWVRRKNEADHYDDDFAPTNVPFNGAAGGADPKAAGRTGGGRRGGGGAAPGTGQGQPARNPRKKAE